MDSEENKFVDHKETIINAPRPRQLNALKVDITSTDDVHDAENFEAKIGTVLTEVEWSVLKRDKNSSKDDEKVQEATQEISCEKKGGKESTTSSAGNKSVIVQEISYKSKESSSTDTVKKYATTVYTQRIGGRKSRSSESDSSLSSPTPKQASSPGSTPAVSVGSPTQICSVQFNVAAGAACSTTTAFSKMFTKTVEANTEVSSTSKERHLSECSFTIGGRRDKLPSQETGLNLSQEHVDDDSAFTEVFTSVKPDEEKEVAEYSPGLAIRTLTLEDLQEKRLTPERETGLNSAPIQKSTDMSTTILASESSSISQKKGFFSSFADSAVDSISLPEDVSQKSIAASENSTSQLSASESSTSVTVERQPSSLTSGGQILMQCTDDTATSLRKPFFNPIEVERKFTMTEHTEEQLKSLGARLHKEKTFNDVYFDNEEFTIIVADCWLRRRNHAWEAKVPLESQKAGALFSPASQYREISNEREISRWLVDHLGLDRWMRGDPVELLVQAAGLSPFAAVSTTCRSYTLPSCTVHLHLAHPHTLQVGEIDVMAASPEELPQALQTISNVALQLGLSPLTLKTAEV